ncbi:MAG: hypothetical protein E7347_01650 [Clostridiales bacterium]|nr:hypothetical protein [Clostridiales bacterium]
MDKREQLQLFLERCDEFIDSKYILADVKLANLLKAIASSDTLLALFQNCLTDFDYFGAQKKYLVKSQHLSSDKGEFVMPPNSRELLAFIFNVLVDIDAKRINLNDFLNKYFFVDGSCSSSYDAFINAMIKPFKNSVKILMDSVIEGKLQDPVEALTEEEERRAREKEEREQTEQRERELLKKSYGASVKNIKELLLVDKQKIKASKLKEDVKEEIILIIDMLANVITSEDKDAITYAYVAYKYMVKSKPFIFFGRVNKISKLIKDVFNGLS